MSAAIVRGVLLVLSLGASLGSCATAESVGASVLRRARSRRVPAELQARFRVVVDSPLLGLAGATTGGLVVHRPGRGRVDLFGPIGGNLATLSCDGRALSVTVPAERKHLFANDADAVIRELAHRAAGVDDLLAMLVGDLPFDGASVRRVRSLESDVIVVFEGASGVGVEARLDRKNATVRSLTVRDQKGSLLFRTTYAEWTSVNAVQVPVLVELQAPALQLNLSLRYSDWAIPSDDNVHYSTLAPRDFVTESLEHAVRRTAVGLAQP